MADHVAAGSDVYRCSYIVPAAAEAFLVGASHVSTSGVHHVLVFRTDLASVPAGVSGPVDCFMDPSNPMAHMRGEVYGSQALLGSQSFPPGVGLPLRAGEVFLVQVHFLDATAKDFDSKVTLTLATSASGVSTRAGVFFFDDPFVDVPAGASAAAAMRCLVPQDVTLLSASSHDHAKAQSFAAYIDPPAGPPSQVPFYAALDAANPLPLQAAVPVPASSRLRFTCRYQNGGGTQEYLQGLDEQSQEMCVLSGLYYPVLSAAAEACTLDPDRFGTGVAACAGTLACVNACPAGSAPPPDLGLSSVPDVDPCWQRCIVASCPGASAPLFALERCTRASCAAPCAQPASGECAACQSSECPAESSACAGDPSCGG